MAKRDALANMAKFKELEGEGNLLATRCLNRRNISHISADGAGDGRMVAVMKNGDCLRLTPGFAPEPPKPSLPYDAEVEWLESTGSQYVDISKNFAGKALGATVKWGKILRFNTRPRGEWRKRCRLPL